MAVSDISPRVAVVTGASSGNGLYTALGLARDGMRVIGMRVIMTGRNHERTETARSFVAARTEGRSSKPHSPILARWPRFAVWLTRFWAGTTASTFWSTMPG